MNPVAIVLLSSLFIGCITSANHQFAPERLPTQISVKHTTKDDVQRLLGQPDWFQKFPNQDISYERWSYWWSGGRQTDKINSLLKVGSLAPRIATHSSRTQLHGLTIAFSIDGRVQSITQHTSKKR